MNTSSENIRSSRFANPFYFLSLLVGTAFSITAMAYGVMAIRGSRGADVPTSEAGQRLLKWLDQSGPRVLIIQVALLAVLTFAAIYSDDYWMARWKKKFCCKN